MTGRVPATLAALALAAFPAAARAATPSAAGLAVLNQASGLFGAPVPGLDAVPFSAIGAVWLVWALGFNMSVGVWVGLIALLGLDAETGVFMLLYLDIAYERARKVGRLRSLADLDHAILEGAARRLRPKFMTFATTFVGLVPILWATGTGADVMKRIAAPMVGGLFTSFVLELVVYPVVYRAWKWNAEVKALAAAAGEPGAASAAAQRLDDLHRLPGGEAPA